MGWVVLSEEVTSCSVEDFFSGVDVWLRRPQVVNRRLLGAVILREHVLSSQGTSDPGGEWLWAYQLHRELGESTRQGNQLSDRTSEHSDSVISGQEVGEVVSGSPADEVCATCLVRELLPKMRSVPPKEDAIFLDRESCTAVFCPLPCPHSIPCGCYKLQYHSGDESASISLSVYLCRAASSFLPPSNQQAHACQEHSCDGVMTPTADWLKMVLLPKIVQWSQENAVHAPAHPRNVPLVPLDRYSKLYYELKEKYGPPLVRNWPEATDPHKFVYEDIAIATYLLILWEEERMLRGLHHRQSFVDLGCGNGLLVYLLTCEGHPGKGIDLRERRIWKLFSPKAQLEVHSLTPSSDTLFSEFDWLIGNHSDELTPWIPVMAARSSYHMNYYVLPCCPHDFDRKFCRPDTHKSQYRSYLNYVRLIGETMGFMVEEDVMRIPSSKRICQVGRKRSYPPKDEASVDQMRQEFLERRCSRKNESCLLPATSEKRCSVAELEVALVEAGDKGSEGDEGSTHLVKEVERGFQVEVSAGMQHACEEPGAWAANFKPRSGKECVRNCSQIDQSVKEHIVETLAKVLLQTENWVEITTLTSECESDPDSAVAGEKLKSTDLLKCQLSNERKLWNCGGKLHLNDAVRLFDTSILQQLKQEIGGLQTLLRNHHQIFQVAGGHVQLRNWAKEEHRPRRPPKPRSERDAKLLVKTKLCWFHVHHPQGCPRPTSDCPYAHGLCELRMRPNFSTVDPVPLTTYP